MSSSKGESLYKSVKPQYPDCKGRQFAGDSATPEYLDVTYDQFSNEHAEDRPMHANTTAGKGAANFSGGQYDDSPGKGGFGSYGVSVDASKNSAERTSVDVGMANRGKEN